MKKGETRYNKTDLLSFLVALNYKDVKIPKNFTIFLFFIHLQNTQTIVPHCHSGVSVCKAVT